LKSKEEIIKYDKEKAFRYISEYQLVSIMNNTKWIEFREAMMNELPFKPPYIIKSIYEQEDDSLYYTDIYDDVSYTGNYDEECFEYLENFTIEWVKVNPRYYEETGGRLVSKKVFHNCEEELVSVLGKYNIPYEYESGVYVIRGYIRTKYSD
jgi:hypothetical protein